MKRFVHKRVNRNKITKKKVIAIILFSTIISFLLFIYVDPEDKIFSDDVMSHKHANALTVKKDDSVMARENFSQYVKTKDGAKLFVKNNDKVEEVVNVVGSVELQLDSNYEIIDQYYKLLDSDYYISYQMIEKIDELSSLSQEYKYYQNYVPFNSNVILKDKAHLYVNDNSYYEVSGGSYPIIVKDEGRYGIEFNHSLVYVNDSDVESVIDNDNTQDEVTDGVTVLNYHYTVSSTNENGELNECQQDICITDTQFDEQVRYLKDNGYYGASIRDLELFIDGKIRLPLHSVLITIDDGWYVSRSITILEKYQMLGTLFLIGSLANPDAYRSNYLEIHSHTWDMHTIGQCPSSVGRGGILCLDENTILEDLRKSRESLNNSTYFCYPFYDYNSRAINLLKQAGFTMAFAGEKRDNKVRIHQDKFTIPRFVIVNYTTMNDFIRAVS